MVTTNPWYMAVILWNITFIYHNHSVHGRQTVIFTVYTTGGTFDLLATTSPIQSQSSFIALFGIYKAYRIHVHVQPPTKDY